MAHVLMPSCEFDLMSPTEVGDQVAFARILLTGHFRLFHAWLGGTTRMSCFINSRRTKEIDIDVARYLYGAF
jgi:hypothetical protein